MRRVREARFLRAAAGPVDPGAVESPRALELAVVAYGNASILARQAQTVAAHLRDDYRLTVFDNSPASVRSEIRATCAAAGNGYVALPPNPFEGDPSASHGAALNWAWRRVLALRASEAIGFLDPDVWPERPTSVSAELVSQPFWGQLQERQERWYLWPGLAFFRRNAVRRLDFMPVPGLDTGGGNWAAVFRHVDRAGLRFPPHSYVDPTAPPGRSPERIGDWIHMFNSSGWRDAP